MHNNIKIIIHHPVLILGRIYGANICRDPKFFKISNEGGNYAFKGRLYQQKLNLKNFSILLELSIGDIPTGFLQQFFGFSQILPQGIWIRVFRIPVGLRKHRSR